MKALLFIACIVAGSATAFAQESWPEFRGPGAQGHSAERGLPIEWSETKNIMWKTPVAGLGWSSPVVANGRVWLTTAVEQPLDAPLPADMNESELAAWTIVARVLFNLDEAITKS